MKATQSKAEAGYKTVARLVVNLRMRDDLRQRARDNATRSDAGRWEYEKWLSVIYAAELSGLTEEIEYSQNVIRESPLIYGWVRAHAWNIMS